jgi:hypothetical protein
MEGGQRGGGIDDVGRPMCEGKGGVGKCCEQVRRGGCNSHLCISCSLKLNMEFQKDEDEMHWEVGMTDATTSDQGG